MTTAQWVGLGLIYLLAATVLVWQLDKLRIQRKYGKHQAEHWLRVKDRGRNYAPPSVWWVDAAHNRLVVPHPVSLPHQRADFLAALVCARDNGDLLTTREAATAEILRFPRPR